MELQMYYTLIIPILLFKLDHKHDNINCKIITNYKHNLNIYIKKNYFMIYRQINFNNHYLKYLTLHNNK